MFKIKHLCRYACTSFPKTVKGVRCGIGRRLRLGHGALDPVATVRHTSFKLILTAVTFFSINYLGIIPKCTRLKDDAVPTIHASTVARSTTSSVKSAPTEAEPGAVTVFFFFFVIRHSFTIEDLVSAPNLKLGCAVILRGCASDYK